MREPLVYPLDQSLNGRGLIARWLIIADHLYGWAIFFCPRHCVVPKSVALKLPLAPLQSQIASSTGQLL
jgi:hypothetical protein